VSKSVEVLLIEDNSGDVLLIRQALADEPYPITLRVARDGEQARKMLASREFGPDIVILDLSIPKRSGLSLLEQVQPDVPVVVFTSSTSPQDRQCSFELGVTEFIHKPTDLRAYSRTVTQMVRNWVPLKEILASTNS